MKNKMLSLVGLLLPFVLTSTAFAQDAVEQSPHAGLGYIAGGLGLGIAAFGGALGQGRAAAAALNGIARNPNAAGKIQTPMIIGLALIESLVIYSLIVALILVTK